MALTSNGVSAYYPVYTYAGLADNRQGLKSPVLIDVVRWQLLRDCLTPPMRDYGTLKRLGMGDAPPKPGYRLCTLR